MATPLPLLPHEVCEGRPYWAAYGDKRWSAVRIVRILRKKAEADRVNPVSEEITKRGAKVRVAELVKRDPKAKGKDKPTLQPSEVFAEVRAEGVSPTIVLEALPPPSPKPPKDDDGRAAQIDNIWNILAEIIGEPRDRWPNIDDW